MPWEARLLFFLAVAQLGFCQKSKNVQISVVAPWVNPPLILEASEYFTEKSQFWQFAELVPSGALRLSDRDQHDTALGLVSKVTSPGHEGSLKFALALRQYAPAMQVHLQLWNAASAHGCEIQDEEGAVALVGSKCIYQVEELAEAVSSCSSSASPIHDSFDHIYPLGQQNETRVDVILYGSLGTDSFFKFHRELTQLSDSGLVRYVLRHTWAGARSGAPNQENLELQGYGVELAIKNMEYKAVDDSKIKSSAEGGAEEVVEDDLAGFDFKVLYQRKPELLNELQAFRDTLLAEISKSDENIKVWALKDLGIQASQRIMEAKEPLRLMRDLSHNLPTLVSSLSRLKVNASMKSEIEANHQYLQPGANLVLINGRQIDPETVSPFGLQTLLRHEIDVMDHLSGLGFPYSSSRKLLNAPDPDRQARMMGMPTSFKIDVVDKDHVFWLNDLETDAKYRQWPRNLQALLQRGWPGQLRQVAKNIYTLVYLIDPTDSRSGHYIRGAMEYIQNNLPARFGVIFKSRASLNADPEVMQSENVREGIELYSLMMALNDRHGKDAAFYFWNQYERSVVDGSAPEVREKSRRDSFRAAIKAHKAKERDLEGKLIRAKYKEALNSSEYLERLQKSTRFVESTGLDLDSPVLVLNGAILQGQAMGFEHVMYNMQMQLGNLQRMVYYGELNDRKPVYDQIVADKAFKRHHKLIVPGPDSSRQYLSLKGSKFAGTPFFDCGKDTGRMRGISTIVALELGSSTGRKLLIDALLRLTRTDTTTCEHTRLAFLQSSAVSENKYVEALNVIQMAMLKWKDRKSPERLGGKILNFTRKVLGFLDSEWDSARASDEEISTLIAKIESVKGKSAEESGILSPVEQVSWVQTAFNLKDGDLAVACAGRVFKISEQVAFQSVDFELAEHSEWKSRAEHVLSVVESTTFVGVPAEDLTVERMSDMALVGSALIGEQAGKDIYRSELPRQWRGQLTGFTLGSEESPLHVTAIMDPLCLATQRLAPMLMAITSGFNASLQVLLNPLSDVTQLPIKGYYRYVLVPSLDFDEVTGKIRSQYKATFSALPLNKLLSMVLHPPDAWFVEASACAHDVDNILLEKLPDHEAVLSATYSLEHILLTGHCTDEMGSPPAGLQLVLKAAQKDAKAHSDTLVMSNLGYFQLKAKPGAWKLSAAEGRSKELYTLTHNDAHIDEHPMLISSFEPQPIPLMVKKRPGFETESLISQDVQQAAHSAANPSLWNSLTSLFGETKPSSAVAYNPAVPSNETIHVFSLASGHLYERFLKIMILSVVRNTKANVKFWLLSNFLSAKFKESIPKLSKKFGFEYQLVTYKWPAWLHKQTEKQRIIWGYKILMLDVLFPLSVPKIIYIDSDQVVRADLRELWHMDLKGRPLAYTPFCDSNKEMEGYRFWKQGFWSGHLGSLKYHISALYVVDLALFRAMGAGDQLRVVYSQLSRDPNSLANLDQDLPNYAQHSVPIFSLPQEWLWCETWCSNDTKPQAKTIDLCNNPMTKEPKLDQAHRIIAEWVQLDEAVKAVDN